MTVVHAIKMHYKERFQDVLAWPWKRFCWAWAGLIVWSAEEAERKAARDREAEFAKLRAAGQELGM
jgi:hypothetical protein